MKRTYETPAVEMLQFNYTDVIVASGATGTVVSQGSVDGCNITPNGRMLETGATCSKDPDRPKNKKCYS